MAFFRQRQKQLSRRLSRDRLRQRYERTERQLETAVKTGDLRAVKAAMKDHHEAEYAMLYKDFSHSKRERS